MSTFYRHTQVGWAILGFAGAIFAFVWAGLSPGAAAAARGPVLLVLALVVIVFSALTVEVDGDTIRLRFGIGLVRKRIPLRDVQSWREVRNPWYSGWGIRLGPGGVLWNVSGFDAVELALGDGKHFRIGTDEPAALAAGITQAKGGAPAPPTSRRSPWRRSSRAFSGRPTGSAAPARFGATSGSKGWVTGDSTSTRAWRPTCSCAFARAS